jgi:diacylglycerol kinase (ATP)
MQFSAIFIICNPNSTSNSVKNAKELKTELAKIFPKLEIKLQKTKYAGHAEKLAYKISMDSKKPLIISSSGDGGYNEVINGAINAQSKGARPVCAVLASGNANDHSRTLQNGSLLASIKSSKIQRIDLLKVAVTNSRQTHERYAHSYVGLGLTPIVATELNKTDLNTLKELIIVLKTFYKYRPFKIKRDNKILKLDSILFANIGEMAKVLTISKKSKPDDGLFEIIAFKHDHKARLLRKLVKAAISGLDQPKQSKKYQFSVLKDMPAQLDGELLKLDKNSTITITSEHKMLWTVL